MNITFLGTGTSQGVPIIGCSCEVCISDSPKDKRLRASVFLEWEGAKVVIDTGPDFRYQMLRSNKTDLDAVFYTHEHKDHIAGLDDIRPINFLHKKKIEVYATDIVSEALKREFHYIFAEKKYPGVPQIELVNIQNKPFKFKGKEIIPVEGLHYKLPVLGFRIDSFCYITDMNYISEEEKSKMRNLDVLVLNALRRESHISHFTLDEALDLVKELNPKEAYFTHISHQLGKHDIVSKELPENVFLAYDNLKLDII